jgi:hypothetical protein
MATSIPLNGGKTYRKKSEMGIFFILSLIQLPNVSMNRVKCKTVSFLYLLSLILALGCNLELKAQKNELEGFYYLMIVKTPAPVKLKANIPKEVKVHLRAAGSRYQEWWLMESTSLDAAEQAFESIYKSFRIPVDLEAHRVRVSKIPQWGEGLELSALRYKMLDYGIKMIDPTDNGYALIDALEDQQVQGIWMLTEEFEGFYLSDSHTAAAVREITNSHEQVKTLKLKQEVISLQVQSGDKQ